MRERGEGSRKFLFTDGGKLTKVNQPQDGGSIGRVNFGEYFLLADICRLHAVVYHTLKPTPFYGLGEVNRFNPRKMKPQ